MPQLTIYGSFETAALQFRAHCGQTAALMAQPIPYPYFHALKTLLILSLLSLGYAEVRATQPPSHPSLTQSTFAPTALFPYGLR